MPPPARLRGRGPTLATMHEIESILRAAREPLSLNEIKRRMRARAVRHLAVRQTVDEFVRLGLAVEGERGVTWDPAGSPMTWDAGRFERA